MELNAREELEAAQSWLAYQNENLSFGLKSAEDALKLWRAWVADPALPEFCDEYEDDADYNLLTGRVRTILGYDPWVRQAELAELS